jgi:hypothetical protein
VLTYAYKSGMQLRCIETVQVLVLRNFGIIVGGETIEEAFWLARNVMTGIDKQVGQLNLFTYECSQLDILRNLNCVQVFNISLIYS